MQVNEIFPRSSIRIYKGISNIGANFRFLHFPVPTLMVSQMRRYSWIHKRPVFLKKFVPHTYIFVHIWEESEALSFQKAYWLLTSISWSIIILIKRLAFLWWLVHCYKLSLMLVVSDAYLNFWTSDAVRRPGKLVVRRSVGQHEPSLPKQHNVSADEFNNSS